MKTLKLHHICGYLPYKLHVRYLHKYASDIIIGEWTELSRLFYKDWMPIVTVRGHTGGFEDFTPILRPLSDLYKTISHDGKEIIPIVECAKIAEIKWLNDKCFVTNSLWRESWDTNYQFGYNEINAFFNTGGDDNNFEVKNQYLIFDYLHELKIDYRGLIDAGLAVSVYDLETNPYE